jgi:hypothetical protein
LKIEGLTTEQESLARRIWSLPARAPLNAGYIETFTGEALKKIGEEYSGVAIQMDPGEEAAVNVVITFRRR